MFGLTINKVPTYGRTTTTTPTNPVELPKTEAQTTTTTNTAANPMTPPPSVTGGCTSCKNRRNIILGVLLVAAIGAGYYFHKPIMAFFKKSPMGD
jgi:hypothetical protein